MRKHVGVACVIAAVIMQVAVLFVALQLPADAGPPPEVYVSTTINVPGLDEEGQARPVESAVDCPDGSHVTGGGVTADEYTVVQGTFPHDDSDDNSKPDDGWGARVANVDPNSEAVAHLTIWAVCQR